MAMQGLTGIFTAVALQFALPSGPPATQPVPHGPGVYTNREFGYRLHVPNGWHISVAPGGEPAVIFNYGPKMALRQGLIQEHGAEIYVVPFAAVEPVTGPLTEGQWIAQVDRRDHTNITVHDQRRHGEPNRDDDQQPERQSENSVG
jgi:hypothetical protein